MFSQIIPTRSLIQLGATGFLGNRMTEYMYVLIEFLLGFCVVKDRQEVRKKGLPLIKCGLCARYYILHIYSFFFIITTL